VDFQIQTPQKEEFKFNEVISLTSVKPYVLRFWETEFIQINPKLNNDGDKIYSKEDILVIKTIKKTFIYR
jgi:DNA-binding transcriptional MerR regulator